MGYEFLKDRIVILDGAMGSVLQQRGLPPGGIPELLNLTDPELLCSIYREYIDAGSEIIYANTFGANRFKLENAGYTIRSIHKKVLCRPDRPWSLPIFHSGSTAEVITAACSTCKVSGLGAMQ